MRDGKPSDREELGATLGSWDEPATRAPGKEVVASLVTPAFGEPGETKKALYVVASRRVRRRRGDLEPVGISGHRVARRGVPANPTHDTGTREIGQAGGNAVRPRTQ